MIKTYLLGDLDPALFVASLIYAGLGILLTLLLGTTVRNVHSEFSPDHFSWKYLWNDNTKRLLANLICVPLTLRFMPDVLGVELTVWKGLIVGLSWDTLFLIIKQKTTWLDPKPKP